MKKQILCGKNSKTLLKDLKMSINGEKNDVHSKD